jgi:hypothetical protein
MALQQRLSSIVLYAAALNARLAEQSKSSDHCKTSLQNQTGNEINAATWVVNGRCAEYRNYHSCCDHLPRMRKAAAIAGRGF